MFIVSCCFRFVCVSLLCANVYLEVWTSAEIYLILCDRDLCIILDISWCKKFDTVFTLHSLFRRISEFPGPELSQISTPRHLWHTRKRIVLSNIFPVNVKMLDTQDMTLKKWSCRDKWKAICQILRKSNRATFLNDQRTGWLWMENSSNDDECHTICTLIE